jgi:hypothetical protein
VGPGLTKRRTVDCPRVGWEAQCKTVPAPNPEKLTTSRCCNRQQLATVLCSYSIFSSRSKRNAEKLHGASCLKPYLRGLISLMPQKSGASFLIWPSLSWTGLSWSSLPWPTNLRDSLCGWLLLLHAEAFFQPRRASLGCVIVYRISPSVIS